MKPGSNSREILLLTTTSYSKRQLCEMDAPEKNNIHNPAEQLEAACWNGLLDDILQGTFEPLAQGNKIFLWQVEKEDSFLRISMGEIPPEFERQYTLDPHIFLIEQELN